MQEEKNTLVYKLLRFTIFYKAYQNLVTKKNTYTFIYQKIFNFQEKSIVLDCGCGPAHYRDLINTNDYTGVDFNENHITKAKKRFPLDKFIHGDVLDVDIASGGPYSEIILFGLLHHLNDKNVRTLLDNLISNLKMEGKIMSIDPVYIKSDLDLYTKIANFVASKDQGNYVRTEKEYKNLFNSMNLTIKTKVYKDLLRIPFFHNVMYISHK